MWVSPNRIDVRIDLSLEGTAISATPKFGDRMLGENNGTKVGYGIGVYDARAAVVLVQNEQEKIIWEEYIQSAVNFQYSEQTEIQPRKVLPNN